MNTETHEKSLRTIHDDPRAENWDPEVTEHVAKCRSCQKTLEALRHFLGAMVHRRDASTTPPEVRSAIRERIHAARRPRADRRGSITALRVWAPVALAAGLVLGFGLAQLWSTNTQGPLIVDGEVHSTVANYLFDVNHDRHLLDTGQVPLEAVVADAGEASAWLSEGLGLEVSLPVSPEGWQLSGTRLWHTVSRLSALAEYVDADERITVFTVPIKGLDFDAAMAIDPDDDAPLWFAESWGYRAVAWTEGDLAWAAVGTLDREALLRWTEVYRAR